MNSRIPDNLILPFTDYRHTEDATIIERGEGPYLFDVNGKKYLDGSSSLWVASLGHNHPVVNAKIREQLKRVSHTSLHGAAHRPAIELTGELLDFMGLPDHAVLFSNSGSEAVEAALKIVMDYWRGEKDTRRRYIVTFEHSYHGETSGAMSVSGFQDHEDMYPHLLLERMVASSPVSTIKTSSVEGKKKRDSLDKIVGKNENEIAAIIIEPVYGAAGILFPNKQFFEEIQAICKEHGYILIIDEVATGFYRTGAKFCYRELGLNPDIIVLGKALSAGYLPLSATIASPKLAKMYSRSDKKSGFQHGHTFSGNPLACAAALGNIEVLESRDFVEKLQSGIEYFAERIRLLSHPAIAEKRQKGMFAGIELFDEKSDLDWDKAALDTCNEAKRNGLLTHTLGNTIVLAPPFVVEAKDIEFLTDVIQHAIENILKGHYE